MSSRQTARNCKKYVICNKIKNSNSKTATYLRCSLFILINVIYKCACFTQGLRANVPVLAYSIIVDGQIAKEILYA